MKLSNEKMRKSIKKYFSREEKTEASSETTEEMNKYMTKCKKLREEVSQSVFLSVFIYLTPKNKVGTQIVLFQLWKRFKVYIFTGTSKFMLLQAINKKQRQICLTNLNQKNVAFVKV